jgi:glutamate-1-semialdehyde aminotransferase
MMELGVEYDPDPMEQWFVSASHTGALIDETLNKFNDAVKGAT